MISWIALALAAIATVAAVGSVIWHRRASQARHELAQRLHDHAFALDQRCDALQHQLDDTVRRQRIDHLGDLIQLSERQGKLGSETARALERYAHSLRNLSPRDLTPRDEAD